MKLRTLLLLLGLLVSLGAGGWYGWRKYTTPIPPDIPLTQVKPETAVAVERALADVRKEPRSAQAWSKLSLVLIANGFTDHALRCLEQTERLEPKYARWPYLRGTLIGPTNPREGAGHLRRALSLAELPNHRAVILFRLSTTLIDDGQFDEAINHIAALGAIEPKSPRHLYALGLLAVAQNDRKAAREHLSKLIDSPHARKKVSSLLAMLVEGDGELARSYQQRSAAFPPDLAWPSPFDDDIGGFKVDPTNRLAEYWELEKSGRPMEAINYLRRIVAEAPDAPACSTLGMALLKIGQFREAEQVLQTALSFDAQNAKLHLYLGTALLHQGERRAQESDGKEAAERLFRRAVSAEDDALKLQHNLGYAHLTRGKALKHLGQKEECLRALREALLCQPESSDIHLTLGDTLAEFGQIDEGLKHLENAVRLADPKDKQPAQLLEKWRAKAKSMRGERPEISPGHRKTQIPVVSLAPLTITQ